MATDAFAVEHLTKRYRRTNTAANDDICFTIAPAALFGVFGPNGAGKTTLVRQMAGLLRPTSGRIWLFGQDIVAHPNVVPRSLGYFGQRLAALHNHTFREVLVVTGVLRGLAAGAARQHADTLIEHFGVRPLASRRLRTLSGGEQRLAALLATSMGTPPVLILDEPTNELDPVRRRLVWDYLGQLNQEHGTTIVLVTHNLLEAERVVGQVAIIDHGRLQGIGTPGELKRRVAGVVRLEVQLREGGDGPASQTERTERLERLEQRLRNLDGATRLRPGRWEITATTAQAAELLPRIVGLVGLEALDDFRLLTPTMEDVYAHFTDRRWERAEGEGHVGS